MPRTKAAEAADPDKLVRQRAGEYRTGDQRFAVRQSTSGWFLVDLEQTDEIGQPLMRGPLPTLDAVRAWIPDARAAQAPPKPKASGRGSSTRKRSSETPRPAKKAKPPGWIDDLSRAEASRVRQLIGALERAGVPRAEQLVRADRQGMAPAVAAALIERSLTALVDDLPVELRDAAMGLVMRAAEVLSAEGAGQRAPLPRWALVEVRDDETAPRRIVLRP